MGLRVTGPFLASDSDHPTSHAELHELMASMDAYSNAAGFASLQAAHDALPAGGGVLYLPPGYQITPTATTTISKPCRILGGEGSKITQGGSGTYALLTISNVDGFELAGVTLDGRYPTRTQDGDLIALTGGGANHWIHHNRLINSHGAYAMSAHDYTNIRVESNVITNSFYNGLNFNGRINRAWVQGNHIETTESAGIFFDDLASGEQINVVVAGNQIIDPQRNGGAGKAGIQTFGSTGNRHRRFKITGNTITVNSRGGGGTGDVVGIGFDQITDSLVQSNHVFCPTFGEGIVVNGYGNDIVGNRVEGNSAGGICLLSYGGEQQIQDVAVVGNVCKGNNTTSGQGINLVAAAVAGQTVTGVLIEANRCWLHGYGIQSYNNGGTLAGSNILIVGNLVNGNLTGGGNLVSGPTYTTANNLPTF